MQYLIIWIIILCVFTLFYIFLFFLKYKIEQLETNIHTLFIKRTNIIPCIYEVSKNDIIKPTEIFKEILALKKIDFFYRNNDTFLEHIKSQTLIHNELNFIFQIMNKHMILNKNTHFIYIRDLVIEVSFEIGKNVELYKKVIKKYNFLVFLKQLTLLWICIPIHKKESI